MTDYQLLGIIGTLVSGLIVIIRRIDQNRTAQELKDLQLKASVKEQNLQTQLDLKELNHNVKNMNLGLASGIDKLHDKVLHIEDMVTRHQNDIEKFKIDIAKFYAKNPEIKEA